MVEVATRLLDPPIAGWNSLSSSQPRGLQVHPFGSDPEVSVTYVSEATTPFGYEYVEFEISRDQEFHVRVRVEGHPGEISTATYLPVVDIRSSEDVFWTWLSAGKPSSPAVGRTPRDGSV